MVDFKDYTRKMERTLEVMPIGAKYKDVLTGEIVEIKEEMTFVNAYLNLQK